MSDVNMTVNAGACMFTTEIKAGTEDGMTISISMDSKCPHVKKLAAALQSIDLMDSILTPINENPLFIICGEYLAHAACPIPVALVKVCEAAGDLCLQKEVTMKYE